MPLLKRTQDLPLASKIPVPKRGRSRARENIAPQAADSNPSRLDKAAQTDVEKMNFLRSKFENSVGTFIKARKELEEVLSAGGSSELGRPIPDVAELKFELQRHRTLTSRVESFLHENGVPRKPCQDKMAPTNSYEFLKSIMG